MADEMKTFYIYRMTNLMNSKVYIGKSRRSADGRKRGHFRDAVNGSQTLLHRAIRKYGEHNFKFEVIYNSFTEADLNNAEIDFIVMHDCCSIDGNHKGYNMTRGGDGVSSETATLHNLKQVKSGSAFSKTAEFALMQSKRAKQRVENGTNPLQGKAGSELQKRRIAEGTHTLAGAVGSVRQRAMVTNGTHPLAGERGSNFQRQRMAEGVHPFVIIRTCPHCGKTGKGPGMLRLHFDKCKLQIK
jgi:group I intron endonuclease